MKTPVVMVGYSRCETLTMSLACLARCHGIEGRDVFLFLDAPYRDQDIEKCQQMYLVAEAAKRDYGLTLHIRRRERNYGVPGNLVSAITEIVNQYGSIIFFEDDVLVSRTFLDYMDRGLALYETDERIFCVNGFKSPYLRVPRSYVGDVYLTKRNAAWGFGIWRDRWNAVDFQASDWNERKNDSAFVEKVKDAGLDVPAMLDAQLAGAIHTWDVQCTYHMVKNGMYAIEPRYSLTKNIGFGTSGAHCRNDIPVFTRMKYYNFIPALDSGIKFDSSLSRPIQTALITDNLFDRIWRKGQRMTAHACDKHMESIDVHCCCYIDNLI